MGEKRWYPPDGADLPFRIIEREAPFSRRIEFQNPRYSETFLELAPHILPEAIPADHPQPVFLLAQRRPGAEQIPAKLPDVLEQCTVPAKDVIPELARRKTFRDHHRPASDQHGASCHDTADAVIHRQTIVHSVVGRRVHHPGKPVAPLHHSKVADPGGLGQPGRARRVNVEGGIVDADGMPLHIAQRFT